MNIPKLYRYLNILSLDVVAGAIICSMFVAKVLKVNMPVAVPVALGLAVWVIYTFDHLMDARVSDKALASERHSFHRRHFYLLSSCMISGLAGIAVLLFIMPPVTVLWGSALGCAVLAYFLMIHLLQFKWLVHKELMVALIYASGIFTGPLSIYTGQVGLLHVILFLQFVIMALLNLIIFSLYDEEFDRRASFPSLVLSFGESNSHLFIKVLLVLEIGLVVFNAGINKIGCALVFLLMLLPLMIIYIYRGRAFIFNNHRSIGDGALILPVIYLL